MADAAKPTPPTPPKPERLTPLGLAHVAIVGLVMGALVWIVFLAMDNAADAGDAAAVLGTVVPGIAAIGAAVFGIPLAYQTGKAGKEEAVKQSHDAGVSDGKKEAVARIDKILPAPSALAAMGGQEGQDTVNRIRAELLDLIKS